MPKVYPELKSSPVIKRYPEPILSMKDIPSPGIRVKRIRRPGAAVSSQAWMATSMNVLQTKA